MPAGIAVMPAAVRGNIQVPKLEWLSSVPFIGDKLAVYYHNMVAAGSILLRGKIILILSSMR